MTTSWTLSLPQWGWNDFFQSEALKRAKPDWLPARVISEERSGFQIFLSEHLQARATLRGRIRLDQEAMSPTVGDWLLVSPTGHADHWLIEEVLPRQTFLARQQAGTQLGWQAMAANVDAMLIATSANEDLNIARLERYVTLAWEAGVQPIIVLTKADLHSDVDGLVVQIERSLMAVPVVVASLKPQSSVEALMAILQSQKTYVLLGSSGVGKSSLVNVLLGSEQQRIQHIREDDDKGRHTTTSRGLFLLPGGALLMDTPGLREIQLGDSEQGFERNFHEILSLAQNCRFRDCAHQAEPDCAVQAAIENGEIEPARWQSYLKQLAEIRHFQRKQSKAMASQDKKKWKQIHRQHKLKKQLRGF
ncbi:MAG: ribosome small subunit-dependent GTPase A [Bdellovibrionales bacterium]